MKRMRELFFDELPDDYHYHLHIGMRMVKTVVAVYICALIGWLRHEEAFFSMIAAVLCMQRSTEKALSMAFIRIVGTAIGGLFGVLLLFAETKLHMQRIMPLYYLAVSLMLIPVISSALAMRKPSAAAFSCVVFLSIVIHHVDDALPYLFALNRMLDTLTGIIVALLVNLVTPTPTNTTQQPPP